ncbi:MAG: TIGR03621 family F420-dependent LLM class oxidoreductase [Chloroflexi bacterium]|nr:MAG: TIGR03621 family F420-dependent LLM class oxidoreductase [Chloroflexota bacterium]
MNGHPFRFGVVTAVASGGEEWAARARRIESLGFSTLVMPDGLRYTLAPMPALAAAAAATRTLRVGTYVIANDFRNPVLLAKEAATLDVLSGGRFELGMGAGRPAAADDNRMLGIGFDSGGVRVARLEESLALLKRVLAGETATAAGPYYAAEGAEVSPRPARRPPILVAGSGRRLLSLAAREADIVALGLQPTEPAAAAAERIGWLREAAGDRFDELELNLNLMAVGDQVPRHLSMRLGVTAADLAAAGSVAAVTGTTDEMCATLERRREELGISYLMVGDELVDAFAPVVERLAGR